jgi:hypothetical protein
MSEALDRQAGDDLRRAARRKAGGAANARGCTKHIWPAILGFLIGCALGGACAVALGLKSVVPTTSLALLAVALGLASHPAPRN